MKEFPDEKYNTKDQNQNISIPLDNYHTHKPEKSIKA